MKTGYFIFGPIFLLLLTFPLVSAITGKIGNGRMILNAEVGDTIDRTIRVINDNNVPVQIDLIPGGDLEKDMQIIDRSFVLQPGEEKNARFIIEIKKSGTFTNKIGVQFSPINEDEKNGVGLSSTIIIKVAGETVGDSNKNEITTEESKGVSVIASTTKEFLWDDKKKMTLILLFMSNLILAIALITLLYYSNSKINKKKKVIKSGDKKDK